MPGCQIRTQGAVLIEQDSWNPARDCGRKVAWELHWNRIRRTGQIRRWMLRQLGIMTVIWGLSYFCMPGLCAFLNHSEKWNSTACMSRALTLCQGSMSLAGRMMREPGVGRLWAGEAWRDCLVSGSARDVCGRSWDHASQGQGDRCLMAFLGDRCLRAETCIWARGAEVRLNDKSASWRPRGQQERKRVICRAASGGMMCALLRRHPP